MKALLRDDWILLEQIADKVLVGDGCWEWVGCQDKGHGMIWDRRRQRAVKASGVLWELMVGPLPTGAFLLHHCDNSACVRPDHLFLGTQKDDLAKKAAARLPLRFWSKVLMGDGCWEWQASTRTGYGQFQYHGRMVRSHRVAWELSRGPIPEGLWVLHHCDNRLCVRPDHLYLGTSADNVDDMVGRGRGWWQGTTQCRNGLHPLPAPGVRCLACLQANRLRKTERRRQRRHAAAT